MIDARLSIFCNRRPPKPGQTKVIALLLSNQVFFFKMALAIEHQTDRVQKQTISFHSNIGFRPICFQRIEMCPKHTLTHISNTMQFCLPKSNNYALKRNTNWILLKVGSPNDLHKISTIYLWMQPNVPKPLYKIKYIQHICISKT